MRLLASSVAAALALNAALAAATCPRYGGPLSTMAGDVAGVVASEVPIGGNADNYSASWFVWEERRNAATTGVDLFSKQRIECFDSLTVAESPLIVLSGDQRSPSVASTGSYGYTPRYSNDNWSILLTYEDHGGADADIYARSYFANGPLSPWHANPVPICNASGDQTSPIVMPAPHGGGFFCWVDRRSGNAQIYASITDSAGSALGVPNGYAVAAAAGDQDQLRAVTDGSGGYYLCWVDHRAGEAIYATRYTSSGVPAAGWPTGGVALSGTIALIGSPHIVADGSGFTVGWTDANVDPDGDTFLHHVAADGSAAPGWQLGGTAIASGPGAQRLDDLAMTITYNWPTDPVTSYFAVWEDEPANSGGNSDIYGARVGSSGVVLPGWPAPLCVNPARQEHARIVYSDGVFCAVYADDRNTDRDLYASGLDPAGQLATGWVLDGTIVSGAPDSQDDPAVFGRSVVWRDFRNRATDGADYFGASVSRNGRVDVPTPLAVAGFALSAPHPNPVRVGARFTLDMSSDAVADVAIFDCAGRHVSSIASGQLRAGRHEFRWDGTTAAGSQAGPGVYFIRAQAAGLTFQRPIVLTR